MRISDWCGVYGGVPAELPGVIGLAWDRGDGDWVPAGDFSSLKNGGILGPLMGLLKGGGGVVVGGGGG